MKSQVLVAAALLATSSSATAASRPGPIAAGTYRCIAGGSRMMLTLGEMTVSGARYHFKAEGGPATSGGYLVAPEGYRWMGPIGAIARDQIVESGADATPGDFWFKFKARPTSSPATVACRRL